MHIHGRPRHLKEGSEKLTESVKLMTFAPTTFVFSTHQTNKQALIDLQTKL